MMKLILSLILGTAQAQLLDHQKASLVYSSIIPNSGFENGRHGWTATGSATFVQSSSTPALGNSKGVLDFSAGGEFGRSTLVAIPAGLYGKNCLMNFKYNGGGTADVYYRITDGTNTIAGYTSTSTSYKITSAVSSWTDSLDVPFICPSSGSLQVEWESAGNAAALSIDKVYVGENYKLGSVAQAEFVGSIEQAGATSCTYSESTSSALNDFVALGSGSGCNAWTATGAITATGTNTHTAVMAAPKPGVYEINISGLFVGTASGTCNFRLSDGTSTYQPQGSTNTTTGGFANLNFLVTYSTAQSSKTFTLQAGDNHAGECKFENGGAGLGASWRFKRFPLASEVVASANIPDQGGTLVYANTTNCQWAMSTATTWTDIPLDNDCPTPSVTGNVSAPATKVPQMLINSLEPGKYMAIAQGQFFANSSDCEYRWSDGTNTSGYLATYATAADRATSLIGYFTYTSKQTSLSLKIQAYKVSGTSCDIRSGTNQSYLTLMLIPVNQNIAPVVVSNFSTGNAGNLRMEFAELNCDASSSVTAQSYSSFVSAIGNRSSSSCAVTLGTGTFSAAPYSCSFTTKGSANSNGVSIASATSVTIYGPASDYDGYLTCTGPR